MRLLLILRDMGILDRFQISPTTARRLLLEKSAHMQQPHPKKLAEQVYKEGAD